MRRHTCEAGPAQGLGPAAGPRGDLARGAAAPTWSPLRGASTQSTSDGMLSRGTACILSRIGTIQHHQISAEGRLILNQEKCECQAMQSRHEDLQLHILIIWTPTSVFIDDLVLHAPRMLLSKVSANPPAIARPAPKEECQRLTWMS